MSEYKASYTREAIKLLLANRSGRSRQAEEASYCLFRVIPTVGSIEKENGVNVLPNVLPLKKSE